MSKTAMKCAPPGNLPPRFSATSRASSQVLQRTPRTASVAHHPLFSSAIPIFFAAFEASCRSLLSRDRVSASVLLLSSVPLGLQSGIRANSISSWMPASRSRRPRTPPSFLPPLTLRPRTVTILALELSPGICFFPPTLSASVSQFVVTDPLVAPRCPPSVRFHFAAPSRPVRSDERFVPSSRTFRHLIQ